MFHLRRELYSKLAVFVWASALLLFAFPGCVYVALGDEGLQVPRGLQIPDANARPTLVKVENKNSGFGATPDQEFAGTVFAGNLIDSSVQVKVVPAASSKTAERRANLGSGTVNPSPYVGSMILTCQHVFKDIEHPLIRVSQGGESFNAHVLKTDKELDLALLLIDAPLPCARIADVGPKVGDEVVSVGTVESTYKPFELRHSVVDGPQYKPAAIETGSLEQHGRSGGGLFLNGKLVGVIQAIRPDVGKSLYATTDQVKQFIQTTSTFGGSSDDRPTVTFYTGEAVYGKGWCGNCPRYKRAYGNGNDKIRVVYSDAAVSDGIDGYPALRFPGPDGSPLFPADRNGNYLPPETLDALTEMVLRNSVLQRRPVPSATGGSFVLHNMQEFTSAIDSAAMYLGEGAEIYVTLIRKGGKQALSPNDKLTKTDILGTSGRIEIAVDAPKASSLLQTEIKFNYRITGSSVFIDADEIEFQIPAGSESIGPHPQREGFALLAGYEIISTICFCYELAHPHVSLWPGDKITLVATLENGGANVEFTNSQPAVHLDWQFLFGFVTVDYQRPLTGAQILQDKLIIEFHKSRFYRDLTVPFE